VRVGQFPGPWRTPVQRTTAGSPRFHQDGPGTPSLPALPVLFPGVICMARPGVSRVRRLPAGSSAVRLPAHPQLLGSIRLDALSHQLRSTVLCSVGRRRGAIIHRDTPVRIAPTAANPTLRRSQGQSHNRNSKPPPNSTSVVFDGNENIFREEYRGCFRLQVAEGRVMRLQLQLTPRQSGPLLIQSGGRYSVEPVVA